MAVGRILALLTLCLIGTLASAAATELVRYPKFTIAGVVEARMRVIPLAGIEATSPDLQCGDGADLWPCGKVARSALQRFVRGRTLECQPLESGTVVDGPARCTVAGQDVGQWLVAQGWTRATSAEYAEVESVARQEKRGIWSPVRTGPFQTVIPAGILWPTGPALSADAALRVEVELFTQTMTVTHRGAIIGRWPVSTAKEGKETPTGAWTAKWLSRDHRSSLYNNAPMPYSIFFEGDYAIHGTYQTSRLGQPASHGCVRLSTKNAKLLFSLVSREGVDKTLIVIRP